MQLAKWTLQGDLLWYFKITIQQPHRQDVLSCMLILFCWLLVMVSLSSCVMSPKQMISKTVSAPIVLIYSVCCHSAVWWIIANAVQNISANHLLFIPLYSGYGITVLLYSAGMMCKSVHVECAIFLHSVLPWHNIVLP